MNFKDWLKKSGLRPVDVAKVIGVDRSSVHHYMSGRRVPEPHTMLAIEKLTKGKVKLADWLRENKTDG